MIILFFDSKMTTKNSIYERLYHKIDEISKLSDLSKYQVEFDAIKADLTGLAYITGLQVEQKTEHATPADLFKLVYKTEIYYVDEQTGIIYEAENNPHERHSTAIEVGRFTDNKVVIKDFVHELPLVNVTRATDGYRDAHDNIYETVFSKTGLHVASIEQKTTPVVGAKVGVITNTGIFKVKKK